MLVDAKEGRTKRTAQMGIGYREVEITKTATTSKGVAPWGKLWLIAAKETGYEGKDRICWHLLTTISIERVAMAELCIQSGTVGDG